MIRKRLIISMMDWASMAVFDVNGKVMGMK